MSGMETRINKLEDDKKYLDGRVEGMREVLRGVIDRLRKEAETIQDGQPDNCASNITRIIYTDLAKTLEEEMDLWGV